MVALGKRMNRLKMLMSIRLGLGAAVIPSSAPVTRMHLTYAQNGLRAHVGARKFWRLCLPRIKFHNPAVEITVKQTRTRSGPALLSVYFAKAGAEANLAAMKKDRLQQQQQQQQQQQGSTDESKDSSKETSGGESGTSSSSDGSADHLLDSFAPAPTEFESVSVINVKGKYAPRIFEEFRELTGAKVVYATEEDKQEMQNAAEKAREGAVASKKAQEIRRKNKEREAMLQAAKEDVQRLRAAG